MSKLEFVESYKNSYFIDFPFRLETRSSEIFDQEFESNINIITKLPKFRIEKVKPRNNNQILEKKEEKFLNKKKNTLIEKNSTNSDTGIKGSNYKIFDNQYTIMFESLPYQGIISYDNYQEIIDIQNTNSYTLPFDSFSQIYHADLLKTKKQRRTRKTYKEKNTKTLSIDNEHFKNQIKNFKHENSNDLDDFLSKLDHFIVLTYWEQNHSGLFPNNFLYKIEEKFTLIKKRKVERKYTSDNAFRNESINCKIINHFLMFCSLIISYIFKDSKIKITIKDKKKKSVEFIKYIMNSTIQNLIIRHINLYVDLNTQNLLLNFVLKEQILNLKLKEILPFYISSKIFKLLIYENSRFGTEEDPYFLDYSFYLVRQSEGILENIQNFYK